MNERTVANAGSIWLCALLGAAVPVLGCSSNERDSVGRRTAAVVEDEAPPEEPGCEPGLAGCGEAEEVTEEDPVEEAVADEGAALVEDEARARAALPDVDADGAFVGVDCDDEDPEIGPLVIDVLCNGVDENCDGVDDCDIDRDGVLDAYDEDPLDPSLPRPEPGEPLR